MAWLPTLSRLRALEDALGAALITMHMIEPPSGGFFVGGACAALIGSRHPPTKGFPLRAPLSPLHACGLDRSKILQVCALKIGMQTLGCHAVMCQYQACKTPQRVESGNG